MKRIFILSVLIILFTTQSLFAATNPKIDYQREQTFIDQMVNEYHFSEDYVIGLIYHAYLLPEVIERMQKPYERKPWYIYRNHFFKENRIQQGLVYWKKHAKELKKTEKKYGVPVSIIVAIIGIESFYGRDQGTFPVLDTLATLAFAYPPRARFFQSELVQYFLLTQELKLNPSKLYGSYAGAMGLPQFMPSSYRYYAVGERDLLHDNTDVIESVANYLKQAGWESGEPIAVPAEIRGAKYKKVLNNTLDADFTVAELKKYDITPMRQLPPKTLVNLIKLQDKDSFEYWLGLHNFYVITRYNTSIQYAMAIYQLAEAIKKAK